jgi:hypothetical protein
VQSLPWNAAAIVVSETMGDATYQVKHDEAVLFKAGHLGEAVRSKQNCGCPVTPPTQVAKANPPPPTVTIATLKLDRNKVIKLDPIVMAPQESSTKPKPAETASKQKHGLFSRVGAFLATIFH